MRQGLTSCTVCVYNKARIDKEWMLQVREGCFCLNGDIFLCTDILLWAFGLFQTWCFKKKKNTNIQLSHLQSLSRVFFSCGLFYIFAVLFFSIVSEAGASIYSVSPEASKEMPDLDPNLRSAGMKSISFYHISIWSSSLNSQPVLFIFLNKIIVKSRKKFWIFCF